jgi:hypothetical protein
MDGYTTNTVYLPNIMLSAELIAYIQQQLLVPLSCMIGSQFVNRSNP